MTSGHSCSFTRGAPLHIDIDVFVTAVVESMFSFSLLSNENYVYSAENFSIVNIVIHKEINLLIIPHTQYYIIQ